MSPVSNPNAGIIDASILVSISSNEAATHLAAEIAFNAYAQNGWEFFAPNVIVAEVIFALCQKLTAGVLTEAEHEKALETFLDMMKIISTPNDETDLVKRV